jgi:Mg2+ and Co2+ transporter CorA
LLENKSQDEKALHSKVGRKGRFDYSVTFRDTQNTELIRRKLIKASFILKSNADVGRSVRNDVVKLAKCTPKTDLRDILDSIQQYISSLEKYERIIKALLDRLTGTRELVTKP